MELRVIIRNGSRIRLSEAKQGDVLDVYETEEDFVNGEGVQWELDTDAFIADLSKPDVWGCVGTVSKLEV
jgi:hypothetical protein